VRQIRATARKGIDSTHTVRAPSLTSSLKSCGFRNVRCKRLNLRGGEENGRTKLAGLLEKGHALGKLGHDSRYATNRLGG